MVRNLIRDKLLSQEISLWILANSLKGPKASLVTHPARI